MNALAGAYDVATQMIDASIVRVRQRKLPLEVRRERPTGLARSPASTGSPSARRSRATALSYSLTRTSWALKDSVEAPGRVYSSGRPPELAEGQKPCFRAALITSAGARA
jgi:hypothetical protein